ncbi:MAG: transposase [Chloroflexia bacterium]|nr:transposase [Chloroflexia bacterium]
MRSRRKQYTSPCKAQLGREMLREQKPVLQIASEHAGHPKVLHKWKAQALEGLPRCSRGCKIRSRSGTGIGGKPV